MLAAPVVASVTPSALRDRDMPPGVPVTWAMPDVALPRLLQDAVHDFPDVAAMTLRGGSEVTHAGLAGIVERVAISLHSRQVARVVLVDAGPVATVIAVHAAWRAGAAVVLGSGEVEADGDEDEPDRGTSGSGIELRVPGWDATTHVAVGTRRRLAALRVPSTAMLLDDLAGLPSPPQGPAGRAVHGLRRLRRRVRRADVASLSDLAARDTQGVLPVVDPDAPAAVHLEGGVHRTFSHRMLVAAGFQVRLWIPDMAAGVERLAVAMPLTDPVALVVGPVLAALTAATLRCDRDPATTVAGATIAFGPVAAWQELARPRRRRRRRHLARRDGSPSTLRIGGILAREATDLLASDEARRIVARTEGARLRHFWTHPGAAGPLAAQPVYGRIVGSPGAEPLTDTVVEAARSGRAVRATGPQCCSSAPGQDTPWLDVTGAVPLPPAAEPRHTAAIAVAGPSPTPDQPGRDRRHDAGDVDDPRDAGDDPDDPDDPPADPVAHKDTT